MRANGSGTQSANGKLTAPTPRGITGPMPEAGLLYAERAAATVMDIMRNGFTGLAINAARDLIAIGVRQVLAERPPVAMVVNGLDPAREMLTVDEFAAITGTRSQHIRRLMDAGTIRKVHLGRSVRIPRAELQKLLGKGGDYARDM